MDALPKPFTSFRAQMVAFIALMLIITTLVIFVINQIQEQRTTKVIGEYIRVIPEAIGLVNRSFSEGTYLYKLVNLPDPASMQINAESLIRQIVVVEENGNIFDSTDRNILHQRFLDVFPNLSVFQTDNAIREDVFAGANDSGALKFSIETEKASRDIFIIISMSRLQRVKEAGDRVRLSVIAGLGVVLILAIAIFSKRFTRPITELGDAARKVTEGNLDFTVPISGPEEISRLSKTFNEMLAGLRQRADLEAQLERAERSAIVGRLASGIAHEIRNPLNFINLSIDHLQASFAPKDDSQRTSFTHILTTIKDELARLNRLVSDFLNYGRPAKLKLRELDARVLVEEVRDLVHAKADEQGVKIDIEQPGNYETKINADAEQIKTCFSNLMINAVQAMSGGGELRVTMQPSNSHLEIRFTDTGSGILPENIEKIFEPYFSTKETGIGLGLPLTKKIIEEHGGQITVTSAVGTGTTFTVTLQRNPSE